MATVKLAEALLRRKELQQKVARLQSIDQADPFEMRVKRVKVTDSVDEVTAAVPKMTATQFNHEFNWHASALRRLDAAIQHANWTTDIEVPSEMMGEYTAPQQQ